MASDIAIKRIYSEPDPADGLRVLVDRLWPRGMRKEDAKIGKWAKELAPSTELRKWLHHDPERFDEFVGRYRVELAGKEKEIRALAESAGDGRITLLYAAKDPVNNHARVLALIMSEYV